MLPFESWFGKLAFRTELEYEIDDESDRSRPGIEGSNPTKLIQLLPFLAFARGHGLALALAGRDFGTTGEGFGVYDVRQAAQNG